MIQRHKTPLFIFGLLVVVSITTPKMVAQDAIKIHDTFLPLIETKPCKKGVALAYGWVANPNGQEILGSCIYLNWGIGRGVDAELLQVFWDDCWPHTTDCQVDYFDGLTWLATQSDMNGILTYQRRPLLKFLNEPDNGSQAAKHPHDAALLYLKAREICPHCIFTFPAVSAWDMYCEWPPHEIMPWHAEINDGGMWCWSRAFLAELNQLGIDTDFSVCSGRHYYTIGWHEPKRDLAPLEPTESLAAVVGCTGFIISEYGTCDPDFMRESTRAYLNDPRVIAFFAWTPNLEPAQNGFPQCEVFFDWHTGELTSVGEAFANAANE